MDNQIAPPRRMLCRSGPYVWPSSGKAEHTPSPKPDPKAFPKTNSSEAITAKPNGTSSENTTGTQPQLSDEAAAASAVSDPTLSATSGAQIIGFEHQPDAGSDTTQRKISAMSDSDLADHTRVIEISLPAAAPREEYSLSNFPMESMKFSGGTRSWPRTVVQDPAWIQLDSNKLLGNGIDDVDVPVCPAISVPTERECEEFAHDRFGERTTSQDVTFLRGEISSASNKVIATLANDTVEEFGPAIRGTPPGCFLSMLESVVRWNPEDGTAELAKTPAYFQVPCLPGKS